MDYPCSEFLSALKDGWQSRGGYQDGRIVDLRDSDRPLYMVGDVHAKPERIEAILSHAQLHPQLESESAVLVFLGDLFHREDERAGEMESSLQTLRVFMDLKIRYPRHVYNLLGNHEFTRIGSTKKGYFQGELFRAALVEHGLEECYDTFLKASPLVLIHPRCVGVHAGPTISVDSLEEVRMLPVDDTDPSEMAPALRELTQSRHTDWCPNFAKSYSEHQVRDFLALCGVPEARLVTGHTPLGRATGWNWDIGQHLTVIFAAGREVGYFRWTSEGGELVRVGRSHLEDDEKLIADRAPDPLPVGPGQEQETLNFRPGIRLRDLTAPHPLLPDVTYRFDYPHRAVVIELPDGERLKICEYRHLTPSSQAYYAGGYYLVGNEFRQQVLSLKRELAHLIGGEELIQGVRFSWGEKELAVLRQNQDGEFEIRALREGLQVFED